MTALEKDKLILKNRKLSMWRVVALTVIIMLIFFSIVLYVLTSLERSICERNLTAFRNSVIIFNQLHNRFPASIQELQIETGLIGYIDERKYQWISSDNGGPPELTCKRFNLSSGDIITID